MLGELRELWRFRELLYSMVERELRIRYKNSVFGFFWSLLNPLVTVLVMKVVLEVIMQNDTPNFSAYILAAYLPFLFFQFSLLDSAQSVISAMPVVRKVYFPREVLPLASVLSNFVNFLFALGVFFCYLLTIWLLSGRQVSPFSWNVLFLPLLLLVHLLLTAGLSLIISALNTFYEDVKYITGVALYLMFFLSPIMYFSETVNHALASRPNGELWYLIYHLNPMATLATAYRKILVPPGPIHVGSEHVQPLPFEWGLFGITGAIALGLFVFGYRTFNRLKWRFAERP